MKIVTPPAVAPEKRDRVCHADWYQVEVPEAAEANRLMAGFLERHTREPAP